MSCHFLPLPRVLSRVGLFVLCGLMASNSLAQVNQPVIRSSSKQHFMVTLIPPKQTIQVNQMHSWQLRVTHADGRPVNRATFVVDGGMPQHNHGLPTKPQVTQNLGHGTFLLEGMKFNMPGGWEINVHIQTDKEKDSAHFPIMIELPRVANSPKTTTPHNAMGMK